MAFPMSPIQLMLDILAAVFFFAYYTWPLFVAAMLGYLIVKAYKSLSDK